MIIDDARDELPRFIASVAKTPVVFIRAAPFLTKMKFENSVAHLTRPRPFLKGSRTSVRPASLKIKVDASEITQQRKGMDALEQLQALQGLVDELGNVASYLSTAEQVLPLEHAWVASVKKSREEVLGQIENREDRAKSGFRQQILAKLTALKNEYVAIYLSLHGKARLGVNDEKRKSAILQDDRIGRLHRLSSIDLMPHQQFLDFQSRIGGLKSCSEITNQKIQAAPVCPHCGFRPSTEKVTEPLNRRRRFWRAWTKSSIILKAAGPRCSSTASRTQR